MSCLQAVTRRAASAAFLLFAAVLLVVAPAEASVPRSAGVDQVDAVALASLERPALGLASPTLEPSRFSLGEDLSVSDTTKAQWSLGLCGLETRRCALTYARNNPLKYVDPDGRLAETVFDVGMAAISIKQAISSPTFWNIAGAALDVGAVLTPFVPAVGGRLIDAAQVGDKVLDAARAGDNLVDASGPARNLPFKSADRISEANMTLDRVETGGPFPFKKDGTPFKNKEGILPEGKYKEYTVETPGANNRGTRRIVVDEKSGATYYTDDHYKNFVKIDPEKR